MRVVVFADGLVGFQILDFLIRNFKEDIRAVVVMGEGRISAAAARAQLPVITFSDYSRLLEELPEAFDYGVLAWWPRILPESVIAQAERGFLNTHPSYLPWNRGKNYNFWALVEGTPFGVTLHMVDKGIDTGAIVAQKIIDYDWTDSGATLFTKAQEEIVTLFEETWPDFVSGKLVPVPQDLSAGSQHFGREMESKSEILLNQDYRARDLLNLLRARSFRPHPGCWFVEDGKVFEVRIDISLDPLRTLRRIANSIENQPVNLKPEI